MVCSVAIVMDVLDYVKHYFEEIHMWGVMATEEEVCTEKMNCKGLCLFTNDRCDRYLYCGWHNPPRYVCRASKEAQWSYVQHLYGD